MQFWDVVAKRAAADVAAAVYQQFDCGCGQMKCRCPAALALRLKQIQRGAGDHQRRDWMGRGLAG